MNLQSDKIIQTARSTQPYPSRDAALTALRSFTGHMIGQMITLLYKTTSEDNKKDVEVMIAVGVKDADQCGPSGLQSPDRWENKYYPSGACGDEFFRVMYDSGVQTGTVEDQGGQGGTPMGLGTTTINIGGNTIEVLNLEGDNVVVDDPLLFLGLDSGNYNKTIDEEIE